MNATNSLQLLGRAAEEQRRSYKRILHEAPMTHKMYDRV